MSKMINGSSGTFSSSVAGLLVYLKLAGALETPIILQAWQGKCLYTDLHTWEIFSELWPVLQRRICFQVNSDVRRDDESMHPFRLYMVGNVRTAHAMDLPAMPG
mmetsp:Transcript_5593/g.10573  ORF Transcript_5593/g.10573 Transcript_5593/m.10573 type:complete len:104 (+) Transcript_5593:872-1183(+)